MKEIGHWINGKMVAGTSGRFADVFNPATGEVQARVALASRAELDAATAATCDLRSKLPRHVAENAASVFLPDIEIDP